MHNFSSLMHLSISGIDFTKPIELHLLPSTLQALDLQASCEHWLTSATNPQHCNDLDYFTLGSSRIFNFKRRFHKMKHLNLRCHHHTSMHTQVIDSTMLVLRLLPETLETLFLSHLMSVHPKLWCNLPSGLKILEINDWMPSERATSIALHAPHVHIDRVSLYENLLALPAFPRLPFSEVSLYLGNLETPSEELDAKLLGLSKIFPPPSPSYPNPPSITSIRGRGWIKGSKVLQEKPESIAWPSSLQILADDRMTYSSWNHSKYLPKTLTELQIGLKPQTDPIVWPQNLTSLNLDYESEDPRHLFESLPPLLTKFKISLISPLWDDEWLSSIATIALLQSFELNSVREIQITERFASLLPPSIVYFRTNGVCSDTAMYPLVQQLQEFFPAVIDFTGARIRNDASFYEFTSPGCWMRYHSGTLSDVLLPYPSGPKLRFRVLALPSTLTHLKISEIDATTSVFHQMTLPSLTKLEIPRIGSIDWTAWTLPSLLHLTLIKGWELSSISNEGFPQSLTHLRCEAPTVPTAWNGMLVPPFLVPVIPWLSSNAYFKFYDFPPSLHTLHQTQFYKWPAPSAALVELKLSNFASRSMTLGNFKITFPNLLRLSTVPFGDWTLAYADLETFGPSMELIECRALSDARFGFEDTPILRDQIKDGSIDIAKVVLHQVLAKFPTLKLPPDAKLSSITLDLAVFQHLRGLWSNANVTTISLSSGTIACKQFGNFLPSTLTRLDLSNVQGLHSGCTKHIPRSVTDLKIESPSLNRQSYSWMPSGLISLTLKVGVFHAYHASALPAGLETLILDCRFSHPRTLSHLPDSLKRLEIIYWLVPAYLLHGLPSRLEWLKLSIQDSATDDYWTGIRARFPSLEIEFGIAARPAIRNQVPIFASTEELLDQLSDLEI